MALTPEDVLNKTFTQTQFRRGYDEREVDDFLDEVVAEMRRMVKDSEGLRSRGADGGAAAVAAPAGGGKADEALVRENRDLRGRLGDLRSRLEKETAARADAEKRVSELQRRINELESSSKARDEKLRGESAKFASAESSADERIATVNARADEVERKAQERIAAATAAAERAENEARQRRDAAAQQAKQAQSVPDSGASDMAAAASGGAGASGLIALAQRLHDEHVAEGRTQREKLVAEAQRQHEELVAKGQGKHDELLASGQSKHDEFVKAGQGKRDQFIGEGTSQRDKLISDAQAKASTLVNEAETKRKKILDDLNAQKTGLENRIAELTSTERDYRRKLKDFITSQLKDLESTPAITPESVKH